MNPMETKRVENTGDVEIQSDRRQKRKKYVLLVGLAITAVALGIAAAGVIYTHQRTQASMPLSVSRQFDFPVFFPKPIPKDFKFSPNSFSANPDRSVLTYALTYRDKPIAITVQRLTNDIPIDNFNPTEKFMSPIGMAYIADIESFRTTAAVVTDKSFILINAPGQIPLSAMKDIINSLNKSS